MLHPIETNEQSGDRRVWPLFLHTENTTIRVNPDQDILSEGQEERPSATTAQSSFQYADTEDFFNEDPRQNHLRKHSNRLARIFCCHARRRPVCQSKCGFSWHTLIGTMVDLEKTYARSDFLRGYKWFRFILIFIDSVLRGIGQVMFANNPLSGAIIMIGLFIGNYELALYGLLGTCVSTLTAHVFEFDYNSIRAGLYGYNGCLTGMGISYFSFPQSPQMIGSVVIMSIFSTIFFVAIGKIFVQRLGLSSFTFSFQVSTWIWLLGALKYRYFFVNGTILSPNLLHTFVDKPQLSNISFPDYSIRDNFNGFFASVAQVYFIDSPYTGAIILVGVCICSRILAFFALFGAVTGQLTAAYLLGLPTTAIHAGLWGFNSVLTCEALGGMFFVLYGYRIWFFTLYGSIMTVLVQAAVSAFLSPAGMPTLTFPFTVICWIFCLIAGSKDLIAVKLTAISIPEDHYHRFHFSRLVKTQFKFLSQLTSLSSSPNEDITWEELTKIDKMIPIFMCSYAYQNNLIDMKILVTRKANIHSTDHNARSPLHISACQGNMRICKWLVDDRKVNVNLTDKFGGTPLYDAFWNGHFELLPFLYSRGARMPACKTKELAFYLNAFVYEDNLQAIKCLISCGFNPNVGDYDGQNALHLAVITNHFDIVRYLMEETCANLEIADQFKQTAMQYASSLSDPAIYNYLLHRRDNHISPTIPTARSTSPDIPRGNDLTDARMKNNDDILGTNVEKMSLPALLFQSVVHGDMSKIANFLEQLPSLNALESVDYDLRSLAHFAAAEGQLKIIRFLSQHCDTAHFERLMNCEDRWGLSPMDEAYRHKHFDICNFIKENLPVKNIELNQDASHSPESAGGNKDMVNLLRKWKKIFLFCTLTASGAAERIDTLFARGYFIRAELYADYNSRTPMHLAAAYGNLNVVEVLIRNGYQGATHTDRWGHRPVDEAQRMKFKEIIDELERHSL